MDAFEKVYGRYWARLYGYALHQLSVREEAEQVVHDVFEALWARRNEAIITQLDVYLMVAVKYAVNKCIRSRITFRKYQEYLVYQQIQQNQAEESVQFNDLNRAIDEALRQLPEKSALVFRMSRLENRSHEDIASVLQLSTKAVEYHLTKSLKHLKSQLRPYVSDN